MPTPDIDKIVDRLDALPPKTIAWQFANLSKNDLGQLFDSVHLTQANWPELDPESWEQTTNGIEVLPSRELSISMTPEQRRAVYLELAKADGNVEFQTPNTFSEDEFAATLKESGISPASQQLLSRLCFSDNGTVFFHDKRLLLEAISDVVDRKAVVRFLGSYTTLSMRLRISRDSELETIAAYWGRRTGREDHLLRTLKSELRGQAMVEVDVVRLLPTFAVERLNNYPIGRYANALGENPDCFWSAINFPLDRVVADPFREGFAWYMRNNFRPTEVPQFGDVVLWLSEDGRTRHAANYVAGDVVFTKNGSADTRPWILQTFDGIAATYGTDRRYMTPREDTSHPNMDGGADSAWTVGKPGPWGTIEYRSFTMDWPDKWISADVIAAGIAKKTQWVFPDCASPDAVMKRMASFRIDLPGVRPTQFQRVGDGYSFFPTDEQVLIISRESRADLYEYLGASSENPSQAKPLVWLTSHLNQIWSAPKLSGETKERIERLSYRRGSVTMFADLWTLQRPIRDDVERLEAAKVLTGYPAVMARLRITPETDIDALAEYWDLSSSNSRSLIESMRRRDEHTTINLSLVLKPFVAERLYRFPPNADDEETSPNSYWTAASFHLAEVDARYANPRQFQEFLRSSFRPTRQPAYGDIVLFAVGGRMVHAAIYIADGLVFTKHGMGLHAPWILTMLADSAAAFGAHGDVTTHFYRHQ
jgi:hypothetical protein